MKVLLVQPPQFGKPGFTKIALVEPLGLEMIAGALIPDHDARIHDMRVDPDLDDAVKSFQPDAVGISCCFTIDVYRARTIAERVKQLGVPFVFVGGLHASLNPPDFNSPDIDCVAVGEGEFVSREIMDTLEAGGDVAKIPGLFINEGDSQKFTGARPPVKDLDELPFAARHLLPARRRRSYYFNFWKPLATIETARGCPHRCNFCSVWTFFQGRCRTKSPERVAEELGRIKERYVLITDDNFLLDVKRAKRIGELLAEKGISKRYSFQARSDTIVKHPEIIAQWRAIGLSHIFIGFESLDQEELKAVNKKNSVETNEQALGIVQSHGITVTSAFIVNPDYGHKEFERLRNYIRSHHIPVPQFTVLTPLPGTDLFKEIEGKILTKNYELYDFLHSVLPTKLDSHEFYKEFASLYHAAYVNSGVVLKRIGPLMAALATRRMSFGHLRKILKSAREFGNPRLYLSAAKTIGVERAAGSSSGKAG